MEKEDLIKRLQGMGIEIGGGVATDVLTGALLNPLTLKATAGLSGVAYGAINFGQGAYTNYLVQRHLYGNEDINWGEVVGSGAAGAIPFMNIGVSKNVGKVVGQAGSIKRGFTGGLATSLISEQTRVGIDENRLLSPEEMAIAAGTGSVFGGGFTAAAKGLKKVQANRAYKNYYGQYASPADAARAKYNVTSDIQNVLYSKISGDDYDDLPLVDPKIGQRITNWRAYAASDTATETAVNTWMSRMGMPKNADGEYVFDYNVYLDAIKTGKINSYTDARIFIGTFQAAGAAKAGKAYEKTLKKDFISRYKTLFDVLGIPDGHFQPHHVMPLKASMPLYHGLVYGSEEWWKLTAHLLKRNIQGGDSLENLQMLIGAGAPTTPRAGRTPATGSKIKLNKGKVKTPHSIQHAYIRDKNNGIGESGQYFFDQALLTTLKNEPLQRPKIADKFLKKMRRGFDLTNDAQRIYNGMFDMRELSEKDLKLELDGLIAVLNKLDNDGYLPDYLNVKKEFQVDLMSKVIKQVEKDGNADAYIKMIEGERELQRIKDQIEDATAKMAQLDINIQTLSENMSLAETQKYMQQVVKRNATKWSIVSDKDDAFEMAEKILKPQFILPNGQTRIFNNSGLTYKVAVNMLANLIYENK
tara:strand:+ start:805 stop:2727 length:1923 start_codon:yes stop_codon:yes gene_type:complete